MYRYTHSYYCAQCSLIGTRESPWHPSERHNHFWISLLQQKIFPFKVRPTYHDSISRELQIKLRHLFLTGQNRSCLLTRIRSRQIHHRHLAQWLLLESYNLSRDTVFLLAWLTHPRWLVSTFSYFHHEQLSWSSALICIRIMIQKKYTREYILLILNISKHTTVVSLHLLLVSILLPIAIWLLDTHIDSTDWLLKCQTSGDTHEAQSSAVTSQIYLLKFVYTYSHTYLHVYM